jgi:gliding motility-associated-like protein
VDSVVVTPTDLPIVDVGADVWRCENGPGNFITATVVNPVGGYSVQWSPSAGLYCDTCLTTYATPDTTTVYCAVVTSLLTGCSSDLTNLNSNSCLVYTVRPRPVADAGPDFEMCQYDTTSTCGIATSAGPLYSFAWSPNFGVNDSTLVCPDFYPPFTTLYTLVVTSNGCPSYADSVLVTVRPTLSGDAGQVRTICANDSTQLDGQYNGAWAPTAFLWTPSAGLSDSTAQTPMASPAATTWYYFTVFNGLCPSIPDSVQVIVNPRPISNAGPDLQLCPEGDSITITGATATAGLPPYTYLWQPSSGLQNATLLNPNLKPDTTTLYTLTVFTGTAPNVCTDIDTMLVTVKPGLNLIVDIDTNTICQGQVAQLTSSAGSGSAVFTWSPTLGLSNPNAANTLANPDTTVTYYLTATEHGCSSVDSIHVRVLDTPDAAFTASSTESCGELSVAFLNLSADGSAYEWTFGDGSVSNQTSPLHTYTQPGTYTVTLVALSPGGCADTLIMNSLVSLSDPGLADFRSTPEPPVEVSLPNSSTISFYDQSQLAVSWTWDFGDGVSSTDRNPNHTFVTPGVYYVTLTTKTADGCENTLRKGPYTVFTPELFVPNVFTPNNDGMNDGFLTNYGGDEAFLLQIFDRWGTKFFQTTNKNEAWQGTNLNGSKATDGVYFYTLRIGDRNYSGNVTLMR